MNTKVFADGANLQDIKRLNDDPFIAGLTTNPTLIKNAGISNYTSFAEQVLEVVRVKPISFEVISDDLTEMREQAVKISSWGQNVYVKIPVTNTKGKSTAGLVHDLTSKGIKVNVTAIFTFAQIEEMSEAVANGCAGNLSVFAGRIADTGRDPIPYIEKAIEVSSNRPELEVIWASPREVLNIFQADEIGCDIITVTPDLIKKLSNRGKDLNQYSLETVEMFYQDAKAAGFDI